MNQGTFDVIIKLTNGETVVIKNATRYFLQEGKGYAVVEKNRYNFLFNFQRIVYIGRKWDLEN